MRFEEWRGLRSSALCREEVAVEPGVACALGVAAGEVLVVEGDRLVAVPARLAQRLRLRERDLRGVEEVAGLREAVGGGQIPALAVGRGALSESPNTSMSC